MNYFVTYKSFIFLLLCFFESNNCIEIKELRFVKNIFFGAAIEDFDSTTMNFFKEDSTNFKYQIKKGKWYAQSGGKKYILYMYEFAFHQHPLITTPFDSGVVRFNFFHMNEASSLYSIDLDLSFKDIQSCNAVYAYINDSLSCLLEKDIINEGLISFEKDEFRDFKKIFISYKMDKLWNFETHYEVTLNGK